MYAPRHYAMQAAQQYIPSRSAASPWDCLSIVSPPHCVHLLHFSDLASIASAPDSRSKSLFTSPGSANAAAAARGCELCTLRDGAATQRRISSAGSRWRR